MRIGIDVDGVLADFNRAYAKTVIEATGRDLFEPGDVENPPVWLWPEYRGYTKEQMSAVWDAITRSSEFWYRLQPLPGTAALTRSIQAIERDHDLYFVTSRPGRTAKRQTEHWLLGHLRYHNYRPTVIISGAKGLVCSALNLDCYLDDHLMNIQNVIDDSSTRAYLLNTSYNQEASNGYIRVDSVAEFLQMEDLV